MPNGTRPAETHSKPLLRTVTPLPDFSQPNQPSRPASQNTIGVGVKPGSSNVAEDLTVAQPQQSIMFPHGQEAHKTGDSCGSAVAALNFSERQSVQNLHEGDIKVFFSTPFFFMMMQDQNRNPFYRFRLVRLVTTCGL